MRHATQPIVRLGPALGFVLCLLLPLAPAFAQPASENSSGNVYSAGDEVSPPKPVDGDFMGVGGRVRIEQPVKGDVSVAGGSVDVLATVTDDVRAAGGKVTIGATVGGELMAAGGKVTLAQGGEVKRDARVYAGELLVEGRIDGSLRASAKKITINGEVKGDVKVQAEEVELGPLARLGGNFTYTSPNVLKKADGAMISGVLRRDVHRKEARERQAGDREPGSWTGRLTRIVILYLGLLACAAVFMLLFPGFAARGAQRVKDGPWLALLVGFVALVAVPIAAVLLVFTLVGLPLAVAAMALYPVLLLARFLLGVLFLARLLPQALKRPAPAGYEQVMGYVAVALIAVVLIGRVPVAGGLLVCLLALAGVGAFVMELFRSLRPGSAAAG